MIDEATWAAYVTAHVRVRTQAGSDLVVVPARRGRVTGVFPAPAGTTVHVITAHNPGGRVRAADVNEREHGRLLDAVRGLGLEAWRAAGGDPQWEHVEESVAVLGLDDRQARELGTRFGQDAVFCWRRDELVVLACSGTRRSVSGWTSRPL